MGRGEAGADSKLKRKRSSAYSKDMPPEEPKRTRVHAQRKFAQGAGGVSPLVSPLKEIRARAKAAAADNGSSSSSSSSGPIVLQKGERPKTEDFLTFLCLRGTDFLPPELDFFNQVASNQPGGASSDEVSSEGEDDRNKDPEVSKNGVAKKSAVGTKKTVAKEKGRKLTDNQQPGPKKKSENTAVETGGSDRLTSPLASGNRQTRPAPQGDSSQDKCRSLSEKHIRQTRSQQADNRRHPQRLSPLGKNGANKQRESDRGARARQRLMAKEAAEADESSDDEEEGSSSEPEASQTVVGGVGNEEEDEEADADEEASSRESSRRPNIRRLEDGGSSRLVLRDSPVVRLKQREGRSTSYDSSGSKESLTQVAMRPSRRTKEAAKNYLNLLGQKLTSKKKDENPLEASICPKDMASISPEHRMTTGGSNQHMKSIFSGISTDLPTVSISRELQAACNSRQHSSSLSVSPKHHGKANSPRLSKEATSSDLCGEPARASVEAADVEPETSETRDSSESKSPKGERRQKVDGKRDKKDRKKSKTSLKDLQNILLAEAKRKIADTTTQSVSPGPSANHPQSASPFADSDHSTLRQETEERIVISQKTGYISVKPRPSQDLSAHQLQAEDASLLHNSSPPVESLAVRCNSIPAAVVTAASLNGPSGRRLSRGSGSGSERTSTPPRKILPKTTTDIGGGGGVAEGLVPQRSATASPVTTNSLSGGGRTNHLPLGVLGAAGLSNRFNTTAAVATLSKNQTVSTTATIMASHSPVSSTGLSSATFSQPLVIQTSVGQHPTQLSATAVAGPTVAKPLPPPAASTLNIPLSSSSFQQTAAVIVPAGSEAVRVPLQMTAMPIQVAGMQQAIQPTAAANTGAVAGARPYAEATVLPQVVAHSQQQQQQQLSYQSITSIPVLGPGGLQYSIPVQSCLGRPQAAVVTVPSYGRPTAYATYGQQQQPTSVMAVHSLPALATCHQQQPQHVYATDQQPQPVVVASQSLPQTITMPSGTTIQYNVNPSSIRQLSNNISGQTMSLPTTVVQSTPMVTAVNSVLSNSTSPLVSPGPPTLSPQIAAGAHSRVGKSTRMDFSPSSGVGGTKQLTRLDGGTGPPILTPPVRKSDAGPLESLVPKSQLTTAAGQPAEQNSADLPPVSESSHGQASYATSNYNYPHQPLHINPYQPAAYQAASYHQPSTHSSSSSPYHSPVDLAVQNPAAFAQPSPQQASGYSLSPVQYNSYSGPASHHHHHHHQQSPLPASSPTSGPQLGQQQHSPLTPSAQYRNSLQQRQQEQQQQALLPQHKAYQQQPQEPIQKPAASGQSTHQTVQVKRETTSPSQPRMSTTEEAGAVTVKPNHADEQRNSAIRPSIYQSKKRPAEKQFIKSKNSQGASSSSSSSASSTMSAGPKPVTQYNIVEDKSSPYAFDFDSTESPQMPFRKSSSPLKPPAMIKKSKSLLSGAAVPPTDPVLQKPPESSAAAKQPSSRIVAQIVQSKPSTKTTLSVDLVRAEEVGRVAATDPSEDASSSDNETTYFIPLQTSGQSFGVAVKLGTDGPSGPNQKVIMTAKLVTNPGKKPMKAKILGGTAVEVSSVGGGSSDSKTIGSGSAVNALSCNSTPAKEPLTPRKLRMPVASSPLSPSYPKDSTISPIADRTPPSARVRMRRALPSSSPPPDTINRQQNVASNASTASSSGLDPSVGPGGGGGRKKRPLCLIGNVVTGLRFPRLGQHAQLMEAPTFRPSEVEFKDPLRYIQKIRAHAEQFGMCRIIPPRSFKPDCNLDDDMRFTAYNQYINRMLSRWGPNAKETAAIKKYLDTQNVDTRSHPLVGGLEVDLPALYHAVQSFGGLSEVIQKKKWGKIAEYLRIARGTHASGNKLDDIYVKWLLPYDTLSSVEREELLRLVEEEWADQSREKGAAKATTEEGTSDEEQEEEDDDEQDAVVKGKSTSLAAFYRLSRNLMSTVFRDTEEPAPHEAEDEYWKIVSDKDVHMQVCQGSIDTGVQGFGFPVRNSQYASHPWNLKVLTKNQRSVLQAMGSVMGVTVPTLHVAMLFTTGCWHRDPHSLPWIDYLHSGAAKIWYAIPDDHSLAFYTAMKQLVPSFCKNRKIWLPSDTTMVSPALLVKHGVSVCRAVQHPGQFIVVFPKSYTSSVSTGYCVSESVYFALADWLADLESTFQDIKDSMEPMMFPMEKILISVASYKFATQKILLAVKPQIGRLKAREEKFREQVAAAGIKRMERLKLESEKKGEEDDEYECHICSANLYLSLIADEEEETTFCVEHGLEHVGASKKRLKYCKFMYTYTREEIAEVLANLQKRLDSKDYIEEPQMDMPVSPDDIESHEEAGDYVEESEQIKPRQRSLPSYIKKEKQPLISSESDEDDDDEDDEDVDDGKDDRTTAGKDEDQFPYFSDDEDDIPVLEALFDEDDEIIRPSSKRTGPRVRKAETESSESETSEGREKCTTKAVKRESAPKMKGGKATKTVARAGKSDKRKNDTDSEQESSKKKKPKAAVAEAKASDKKEKKLAKTTPADAKSKKKIKKEVGSDNEEAGTKNNESSKGKKSVVGKTSKSPGGVAGKAAKNGAAKTPTVKKTAGAAKAARDSAKKVKSVEMEHLKKRRSKKRRAKTMDAADKFNLLDIILTETDDEMPVSASEEEEESSSSEDDWK